MKKKIEIEEIYCDACSQKLEKLTSLRNDGSWQRSFISKNSKFELCFTCSLRIFENLEVDDSILEKEIEKIKDKNKPFSLNIN